MAVVQMPRPEVTVKLDEGFTARNMRSLRGVNKAEKGREGKGAALHGVRQQPELVEYDEPDGMPAMHMKHLSARRQYLKLKPSTWRAGVAAEVIKGCNGSQ
eukprot:CAMPEP_0175895886 /NCGR_PEP_ID=MMETSP0107_2-20121207/50746_1 /TAXON_ID=195067 ORGANISM="Goniomonas pacifica, Strain CCMP1869" /NCGR_SAMPLE_ID=MMETSP0107_2 /ASSEMBLY_ACC=CAM_ASM_000203 /LENGTH=100 /DNA_ID=CAMNT_0017217039 /DNA_START=701 /DNA_END=1004 /DNA_ORIENTATION=+